MTLMTQEAQKGADETNLPSCSDCISLMQVLLYMLLRYHHSLHHPFFGAPSLFPCLLTLDSLLTNPDKYAIQDTWIGSDLVT